MPREFTAEEKEKLSHFVTNVEDNVFALKNLPEEVKGALFSRYSRTSKSVKELLLDEFLPEDLDLQEAGEFGSERARQFYERVLIQYGDDSVQELGFAHVAVEGVSNLVVKMLEDPRIGLSPLEKSTRYVFFDKKVDGNYLYYRGEPFSSSSYFEEYVEVMDFLFDTYAELANPLMDFLRKRYPPEEGQDGLAYRRALRAKACDVLRNLLPVATLTNVGLAGNARAFEYLLIKLRATGNKEASAIADKMEQELKKLMPTFVKRASAEHGRMWSDFISGVERLKQDLPKGNSGFAKTVQLVRVSGTEEDILALAIASSSGLDYERAKGLAYSMPKEEKEKFFDGIFSLRKNRRHKPPREFEEVRYTFEIVANFGAYRDLQRHRMLTQFRQPLTPYLGYDVPSEIIEAGFERKWEKAMERARKLYEKIEDKNLAQYVLPFAYRTRFFFTLTLREAFHLCELRSQEQGHPDYRAVAIAIADEIARVHPFAGKMLFLNRNDISLERYNAEKRMEEKMARIKPLTLKHNRT